jgi:hypothetical protein
VCVATPGRDRGTVVLTVAEWPITAHAAWRVADELLIAADRTDGHLTTG